MEITAISSLPAIFKAPSRCGGVLIEFARCLLTVVVVFVDETDRSLSSFHMISRLSDLLEA